MIVACPCGQELRIDEENRASCAACGRHAYFAVVAGEPRKLSPWYDSPTAPTRLPYADRD